MEFTHYYHYRDIEFYRNSTGDMDYRHLPVIKIQCKIVGGSKETGAKDEVFIRLKDSKYLPKSHVIRVLTSEITKKKGVAYDNK